MKLLFINIGILIFWEHPHVFMEESTCEKSWLRQVAEIKEKEIQNNRQNH